MIHSCLGIFRVRQDHFFESHRHIDERSSGKILINGDDVSKMSDNEKSEYRNNSIGFIFQNFTLIRKTIKDLENELDPDYFWKIHRGAIVNVAYIIKISRSITGRVL